MPGQGKLVSNTSCRRNPDERIETLEQQILAWFDMDESVRSYLRPVRKAYPRNIRDNFAAIARRMTDTDKELMKKAMTLHLEASSPGVNSMLQTLATIEHRNRMPQETFSYQPLGTNGIHMADMVPDRTSMTTYASLFN